MLDFTFNSAHVIKLCTQFFNQQIHHKKPKIPQGFLAMLHPYGVFLTKQTVLET